MNYNIYPIEGFECDVKNPQLPYNAWVGHRNFAYDFMKFITPEKVVELGTHHGCSFFAMAQAIKDFSLKTELIAVDTWQGEEHAGFYDESVFDQFNTIKNEYYNHINIVLKRMLFDEALQEYSDNCFDLIHIDGLHTYEAVQHDFSTWLPKLKEDGVILFHDIYSLPHFGTNRFWQEIKQQYEYHFEFTHCYGLGVLFPKGNKWYKKMIENKFKQIQIVYKQRFEYNEMLRTCNDLKMGEQKLQTELHQMQKALQESQVNLQQVENTLTQTASQLSQTQNYLSVQYENNSLFKIIKTRFQKKLVHEKWAKYPKNYTIYGVSLEISEKELE